MIMYNLLVIIAKYSPVVSHKNLPLLVYFVTMTVHSLAYYTAVDYQINKWA